MVVHERRPWTYNKDGVSRYYREAETSRHIKRVPGSTGRSKVLRKGDITDLKLDDGPWPKGLKEYIRTTVYKGGPPVYVFDDHNHALFAWYEAFREKRIRSGARLFHFDEHSDGESSIFHFTQPQKTWPTSARFVANYAKELEINGFIAPAIWMGLVGRVFWIRPYFNGIYHDDESKDSEGYWRVPRIQVGIDDFVSMQQSEMDPQTTIVDIDIDYFTHIDNRSQRRELDILRCAMQKAGVVTIATSPGYIEELRATELVRDLLAA